MAQKRTQARSTSDRDIVTDRHLAIQEALYLPQNKTWDENAPSGSKALALNTGMDGKTRPVIMTADGPIEVALKDELADGGGGTIRQEYPVKTGSGGFPSPGSQYDEDGKEIIYCDLSKAGTADEQWRWSPGLNDYVRIMPVANTAPEPIFV